MLGHHTTCTQRDIPRLSRSDLSCQGDDRYCVIRPATGSKSGPCRIRSTGAKACEGEISSDDTRITHRFREGHLNGGRCYRLSRDDRGARSIRRSHPNGVYRNDLRTGGIVFQRCVCRYLHIRRRACIGGAAFGEGNIENRVIRGIGEICYSAVAANRRGEC